MNLNKTIIRYALITIGIYLFGKIYTVFGHGVTSSSISSAYLYLLGLGVLGFFLLKLFIPEVVHADSYLIFFRTYNSGVAILVNRLLLNGILEIAGGTSAYVSWFFIAGYGLIVIAILLLANIILNKCFPFSYSGNRS